MTSRSDAELPALPLAAILLRQRHAGRKVLVVEDDRISGLLLRTLLGRSGLVVDIATDGVEALERLAASPDYLLVLMDLDMPRLDGLTTTRMLRAAPRFCTVPVIAVTVKAACETNIAICREAGMNAHIAKPVEAGVLYQTMLACLLQGPAAAR